MAQPNSPQIQGTAPDPTIPGRPDWRRLHLWQIQPVRDLLVIAMVVGVLYVGYLISVVTVPALLALLLAYLFEPLVKRLCRYGFSRAGSAIGIIVVGAVALIVPATVGLGVAVVEGARFAQEAARSVRLVQASVSQPGDEALRERLEGGWLWVRDIIVETRERAEAGGPEGFPPDGAPGTPVAGLEGETGPGEAPEIPAAEPPPEIRVEVEADESPLTTWRGLLGRGVDWAQSHLGQIVGSVGQTAVATGPQAVAAVVGAVTSVGMLLFGAALTAFFFFFFVTGWGRVLAFWDGLIPDERKARTHRVLSRMDGVIAGFVRGRLTIVLILAVYMTLAYWLIGVPAAFILGPIVGLLFIVPFVHVIGVPIAMLLMWLGSGQGENAWAWQQTWWWIVFAPIGVYLLAQTLDDWVLSPIIQGKNTEMDMPTILFASLAGGALAGIYGLLIAIPAAACLKILANEYFWPRFEAWARGRRPDFLPISRDGGVGT